MPPSLTTNYVFLSICILPWQQIIMSTSLTSNFDPLSTCHTDWKPIFYPSTYAMLLNNQLEFTVHMPPSLTTNLVVPCIFIPPRQQIFMSPSLKSSFKALPICHPPWQPIWIPCPYATLPDSQFSLPLCMHSALTTNNNVTFLYEQFCFPIHMPSSLTTSSKSLSICHPPWQPIMFSCPYVFRLDNK